MVYFELNHITVPPNDEVVDAETQLNDNWTEIDTKITAFNQKPADFTGITIPKGTEAFDPEHVGSEHRVAVYNGTTWARSLNHPSAWSVWQTITLRSPVVERTGFTPVARVDSVARRVVLMGGVYSDSVATPWSTSTTVEITDDTAIQQSIAPVHGESIQQGATGQITSVGGFASAVIIIKRDVSPDRTSISVRYQGDSGGGDFIMLDGIQWWY